MTPSGGAREAAVDEVRQALAVLAADHPLPWRAAELTSTEYWGDDLDGLDRAGDVYWCGIVDAAGRPVPAFGYHPRGACPPGEPDLEYVALATIVNAAATGTRSR